MHVHLFIAWRPCFRETGHHAIRHFLALSCKYRGASLIRNTEYRGASLIRNTEYRGTSLMRNTSSRTWCALAGRAPCHPPLPRPPLYG